ncbi:MAG: carboxypeptidase-like regulatory domain-containing protein [Bacteroidota bacterium]
MKNFLLIGFCVSLFCSYGQSKSKGTISGFVRDEKNGEVLIGATVLDKINNYGTVTNNFGFYSLTIPKNQVALRFSYVGYQSEVGAFPLNSDTLLTRELKQNLLLKEVIIRSEKESKINETSQTSFVQIPIKQIQLMPAFNGEIDVLKSLQLIPGVKSGNEGSAGIYVRGGGQDQNLILVNGVPVYNATHLYGFYSIFNPDAVNSISLYKGGFPARYGGRLSSVVDITMKEGNMHEFNGLASFGLITVKGMVEGPIIKDKMSFMASGRTSHFDPFLASGISKGDFDDVDGDGFQFYDLNFKINFRFNEKNRLFLSGYNGRDESSTDRSYQFEDSTGFYKQDIFSHIQWGNKIGSLRWYHLFNNKIFSNLSLSYNQYDFSVIDNNRSIIGNENKVDTTIIDSHYKSGIKDFTLDYALEFSPNPNHDIQFGVQGIYHSFSPGILVKYYSSSETDEGGSNEKISPLEYSIYLEDDFVIIPKIKANLGIRFNDYHVRSENYSSIQPRISLRYAVTNESSIKTSYSLMQQNVHLLTNAGIGLPTDLWLPATDNAQPLQSHQFVLGMASKLGLELEFTGEAYYKKTTGLIEYKNGASYLQSGDSWENLIEHGRGDSYGLELMLQKKTGKLNGWIGYTLSWTNRLFPELNSGERFPYRYDSRHDIKAVVIYRLNKNIFLSSNWLFRTGNAVTIPTDAYRPDLFDVFLAGQNDILHYPARNNFRMRNYHRLDISATYEREFNNLAHSISVSAYNVYNRRNPYFLEIGYLGYNQKVLRQESLFGIVPSISYTLKF